MSSVEWTERADVEAATQPIPTLAKATRRVCISGGRKTSNTKKSGLEEVAPTKFTQEKREVKLYLRYYQLPSKHPGHLRWLV